jgi:poly(A) polymerase
MTIKTTSDHQILPMDCLSSPDILRLFRVLGDKNLRFVGGCVRNALMGLPIGDIDLATTLPPETVSEKLTAKGIKVVPTGIDHGTVTAVLNGVGYEITTLRHDVETDGRRATVSFTDDWAADAARRDFTVNALYVDSSGHVYDPLGTGLPDIARRKIRFIGNAETRIHEDALRILRFFRFHTYYGRGAPDRQSLTACITLAPLVKNLSRERVTKEFFGLLAHPRAGKTLSLMAAHAILPHILPKKLDTARFDYLIKLQSTPSPLTHDALMATRLFSLGLDASKKSALVPNHLIINTKMQNVLRVIDTEKIKTLRFDYIDVQGLLYRHGHLAARAVLDVAAATQKIPSARYKKLITLLANAPVPIFPVTGKDLIARGMAAGPDMGRTLKRLETCWIKSGFSMTRAELLLKIN